MAKIKRLFIDMDFGIIYKNQFNGMPLTAAQIEAHKVL
jgi:hypothetical protein